jgi:hypothetical protein
MSLVSGRSTTSFSQNTITNESNDNISNFMELKSSQDSNNSFPGKYDNDQINEIIYGLYEDYLHSDKNDIAHYHYIAILIDFICSNKFYENNIEACDMVGVPN